MQKNEIEDLKSALLKAELARKKAEQIANKSYVNTIINLIDPGIKSIRLTITTHLR